MGKGEASEAGQGVGMRQRKKRSMMMSTGESLQQNVGGKSLVKINTDADKM